MAVTEIQGVIVFPIEQETRSWQKEVRYMVKNRSVIQNKSNMNRNFLTSNVFTFLFLSLVSCNLNLRGNQDSI